MRAVDACRRSAASTCPITLNQERRLVFEEAVRSRGDRVDPFHIAIAVEFSNGPDLAALERALVLLGERHGALRAGFVPTLVPGRDRQLARFLESGALEPGLYEQQVHDDVSLRLDVVDLTARDEAGQLQLRRAMSVVCTLPFEYEHPPLARAVVLRQTDGPATLVFVIHHLIADRESVRIIRRDLQTWYRRLLTGSALPAGRQTVAYDGALQALSEAAATDGARALAYWQGQWARCAGAQFESGDFPPEGRSSPGGHVVGRRRVTLAPADLERIRRRASRSRVTPYMLYLAVLAIVLERMTGKTLLPIWANVDSRARARADGVVGWLIHAHLLGIPVDRTESGAVLLERVRTLVLSAIEYGHVALSELWRQTGRSLAQGLRVSFDVAAASDDASDVARAGGPTLMRRVPLPGHDRFASDFELLVCESNGGVQLSFRFWPQLLTPAQADRLIEDYVRVLRRLVSNPAPIVSTL